jgi:hypothetical protein
MSGRGCGAVLASMRARSGAAAKSSGGFRVLHEPRSESLPKVSGKFTAVRNDEVDHTTSPTGTDSSGSTSNLLVNVDAGECRVSNAGGTPGSLDARCATLVNAASRTTDASTSILREIAVTRLVLPKASKLISQLLQDSLPSTCASLPLLAEGMLPALIFECIGAGATVSGTLLPNPTFLPGGSHSLRKRCATLLHDHQHLRGEDLERASADASEKICKAFCDFLQHKDTLDALGSPVAGNGDRRVAVAISSLADNEAVELCCEVHSAADSACYKHQLVRGTFEKLKLLYRGPEQDFLARTFAMLERYYGLTVVASPAGGGQAASSEAGWHAAVPPAALRSLRTTLGAASECFASPFNTSSAFYGSAFADTDCFFGSLGSFFDCSTFFEEGTFEANPPFDPSVASHMMERMVLMLDRANRSEDRRALAFVIVLPWADQGKGLSFNKSLQDLAGVHKTFLTIVPNRSAPFVDGNQHCERGCMFLARLDTGVMVLQSDAHRARYGLETVEAAVNDLVLAWAAAYTAGKRGREADIDANNTS